MTAARETPSYFASLVAPACVESVRAGAGFLVQAARSLEIEPTHERHRQVPPREPRSPARLVLLQAHRRSRVTLAWSDPSPRRRM